MCAGAHVLNTLLPVYRHAWHFKQGFLRIIFKDFSSPQVSVVWPEKHTSVFKAEWLKRRCFSAAARQALQEEFFLNGTSHSSSFCCHEWIRTCKNTPWKSLSGCFVTQYHLFLLYYRHMRSNAADSSSDMAAQISSCSRADEILKTCRDKRIRLLLIGLEASEAIH